jgi:uroporphyrin-III C-methyltransferase/precorrin-2 dehydrogenase/sirohydrochlorin ferrochelatase
LHLCGNLRMDFFPLFARLNQQHCLVVGGGEVAHRKAVQLLRAGATVTVNAPDVITPLKDLSRDGQINLVESPFDAELIADHILVIAATSEKTVNHEIAAVAKRHQRLCNVVDDGDASTFIMPSVIDRSPLMIAVSTGGASPVLARMIRQQIEEWLPSGISRLAAWAGDWRDTVKKRLTTHAARLHFWQDILDGETGSHVLAGRLDHAERTLQEKLSTTGERCTIGEAWIVGAGPGDPDLITRRGLQLLQRADVVLHDRLVSSELLAMARRDATITNVGKKADAPSTEQADINAKLVELVRAGKRVCRLKGGDPFLFGRGGEEISALAKANLPYQVVPGITAASGCAAYAGIPLTHRDLAGAVTLVTASRAAGQNAPDWDALARAGQTLVIYMGTRNLNEICMRLINAGLTAKTPAAIVEQGTLPEQRVIGGNLHNISARAGAAGLQTPALLIVGAVTKLTGRLAWFGTSDAKSDPSRKVSSVFAH